MDGAAKKRKETGHGPKKSHHHRARRRFDAWGGVALGAAFTGGSSVNAATTTPTSGNTRSAGASASPGVFVSNEDPAHEATESAEREAQENAGQRPTVP